MSLDVVRGWYEALEADDVPSAVALCSPEVEVRYPAAGRLPYGGTWRGPDGVERWAEAHDSVEEILAFRTDDPIADGDRAAVPGFFRGRSRGTGREWETWFVHVLTVRDGRLVGFEAHFDTAAAVDAHQT
jgi:uncharacterized protein